MVFVNIDGVFPSRIKEEIGLLTDSRAGMDWMNNSKNAIELLTHRGPRDFMDHAGSLLLAHEAENNLLIGIADGLAAGRDVTGGVALRDRPQFTVVEQEGQVVMTAVRVPPYSLVVSRGPRSVAESVALQLASTDTYPGVRGHASTARPVAEGIAAVSGAVSPFRHSAAHLRGSLGPGN